MSENLMDLTVADDVMTLTMRAGKANAMSPIMIDALAVAVEEIRDGEARALVITGEGRAFSAGLALPELIDLQRSELREFMNSFADAMSGVLTLPIPTIAAINGHAIAGGCVLALMCDYRVMSEERAKIGLTEVQLGISLPSVITESLRHKIPAAALTPIALLGELFSGPEAQDLGLVNEAVASDEVLVRSAGRAKEMIRPARAFAQVKADLARPMVSEMRRHRDGQLEAWLNTWYSSEAQLLLQDAVSKLAR